LANWYAYLASSTAETAQTESEVEHALPVEIEQMRGLYIGNSGSGMFMSPGFTMNRNADRLNLGNMHRNAARLKLGTMDRNATRLKLGTMDSNSARLSHPTYF